MTSNPFVYEGEPCQSHPAGGNHTPGLPLIQPIRRGRMLGSVDFSFELGIFGRRRQG